MSKDNKNILVAKDRSEFEAAIKSNKYVVVDCFAEWCGPCRKVGKFLEELAKKEPYQNVLFIKVNVDSDEFEYLMIGKDSIPLIHFYKDGQREEESSILGNAPKEIEKNLALLIGYGL